MKSDTVPERAFGHPCEQDSSSQVFDTYSRSLLICYYMLMLASPGLRPTPAGDLATLNDDQNGPLTVAGIQTLAVVEVWTLSLTSKVRSST